MPSEGPAATLHTDVVEIPEKLILTQVVDIYDTLANKNNVLEGASLDSLDWQQLVVILQEHQGFSGCLQGILVFSRNFYWLLDALLLLLFLNLFDLNWSFYLLD